jgi:hypothetical protein
MEQVPSILPAEPLTLEAFDRYVAAARAERSKAIAEFCGAAAAALFGILTRLVRRSPASVAGKPVAHAAR